MVDDFVTRNDENKRLSNRIKNKSVLFCGSQEK